METEQQQSGIRCVYDVHWEWRGGFLANLSRKSLYGGSSRFQSRRKKTMGWWFLHTLVLVVVNHLLAYITEPGKALPFSWVWGTGVFVKAVSIVHIHSGHHPSFLPGVGSWELTSWTIRMRQKEQTESCSFLKSQSLSPSDILPSEKSSIDGAINWDQVSNTQHCERAFIVETTLGNVFPFSSREVEVLCCLQISL